MKHSPARILDGSVQEHLQRLQLALHRNTMDEAINTLPGLQALAYWQRNRTLGKLLSLLAKALAGWQRAPEEQHAQWLPHVFRLLQAAAGPRSRLALLSARLPPAGTTDGIAVRRFLLGLPATRASWPQQAEAREHLRTWLQQELQDLGDACGQGPWELEDCLPTGRGPRLRRMTQLAPFLGQEEGETFALLELLVILLHSPALPADTTVPQLQKQMWRLSLGRPVKQGLLDLLGGLLPGTDQPAGSEPARESGCDEVQQGLQVLQDWCLQHQSDAGLHVSEGALFESGRLAWVLLALDATLVGTLLQVVHRVFTDYWYLHRPLPDTLVRPLGDMLSWLASGGAEGSKSGAAFLPVGHWLGTLIAALPQQAGSGEERLLREVRVQDAGGQLLPPRMPADLPAQLAARLHVIPAHEPLWCRDFAGWQSQGPELVRELLLLEQGAAALRLAPLERYCASLLDLLYLLPLHPDFPAALLLQARECLLHMLDRAALWLAPVPDAGHVAVLQQWLTGFAASVPQALQNNVAPGSERWLRLEIEQLLRPAADILDRSLRVEVASVELVPPRTSCTALLRAVQVLLRWLLSCSEADARERRERGRPQAMRVTLWVERRAQTSEGPDWQVRLFDADGSVLPDQRQLARLARKGGLAHVCCRAVDGKGREFSLLPHSGPKPV